jgi:hypothetical protein
MPSSYRQLEFAKGPLKTYDLLANNLIDLFGTFGLHAFSEMHYMRDITPIQSFDSVHHTLMHLTQIDKKFQPVFI